MRALLFPVFLVLLAVGQTSLFSRLQVLKVSPDVVVIAVVVWGIVLGWRQGLLSGLLGGLLLDLFSVTPFGAHTTALALVAALSGLRAIRMVESEVLLALLAVFGGTLLYYAALLIILELTAQASQWGSSLLWIVLPSAVVNAFLTPPVYWFLSSLARRVRLPEPAGG